MEPLTVPSPRIESVWCPATPDSDDPDTEGRDVDLARIKEWEAIYGSRRRLKPYPAPPQWRQVRQVRADDPRIFLDKTVRTVRGRGKWRETETWELPFPELLQAWNTWLVFRKCEHGPLKWHLVFEFSWWGRWVEFDD